MQSQKSAEDIKHSQSKADASLAAARHENNTSVVGHDLATSAVDASTGSYTNVQEIISAATYCCDLTG